MDAKELIGAGLTENQAVVFLEVLNHPGLSGGEIARKVSIDRSFVYGILASLIDKGIMGHVIKGTTRRYYAGNPDNLLREIDEKRKKISIVVEQLKQIRQETSEVKSVQVYEGKAGLKAYVRDFLDSDNFETLGGGTSKIFESLKYEYPHYLKEFQQKRIKGRIITSSSNADAMKEFYGKTGVSVRAFKFAPRETNFTIFRNKVAIYSAKEKPYIIIIDNKNIAESLRNYFEQLWKIAERN